MMYPFVEGSTAKSMLFGITVATIGFLPSPCEAQNLVRNPSFELPGQGYMDIPGGSLAIPGWETILNGVEVVSWGDLFASPTEASDGRHSICLAPVLRPGGGGLQQSFATVPGQLYELTFDLGTLQGFGRDGTSSVEVTIGSINQTFQLANSASTVQWREHSIQFVASDLSTRLAFSSLDDPALHFALVDDVAVVSDAPDPVDPVQPNRLFNASFEEPAGAYLQLPGGSEHIKGWTTALGGVEVITSTDIGVGFSYPTVIADGDQAICLTPPNHPAGGAIEQTFATQPGREYEVSFQAGTMQLFGKNGTGSVEASVDGNTRTFDLATAQASMDWSYHSFRFVADDHRATLRFSSTSDPFFQLAAVDAASVRAMPDSALGYAWSSACLGIMLILGRTNRLKAP
jgi:Protein of unknown function (DUF642)